MWKTRILAAFLLVIPTMAGVAHAQEPPPAQAPQPPSRVVTGLVEDANSREPLAGATVTVKGTAIQTTTDDKGFFIFTGLPAGQLTFEVAAPGHDPTDVPMAFEHGSLRIALVASGAAAPQPAPPPGPPPAATRTVRGIVTEKGTGVPVIAAQVQLKGSTVSVLTEDDGTYVFEGLPVEDVVLEFIDAEHITLAIKVPAGKDRADVVLNQEVGEVIEITQRAPRITRTNIANGASTVKGEDLSRVSAGTVDDAMQGKVAGANIQSNSGAPGGGVQVRLRGVSTINGQSSPLYVIDGVVISNVAIPSGIVAVTASSGGSNSSSTQDNQVNRIADIDVNDIESIEILKGASAAALYGSKAANGVVIITTKRGRGKKVRASITQRVGFSQISNELGSRKFANVQEAMDAFGPSAAMYFVPGQTYDHEAELTAGTHLGSETIASISGGGDAGSYVASLLIKDDPGIMIGTGYEKQSFKLGLARELGSRFKMNLSANFIHADTARGLTNNDNATVSHYMVFPGTPSFLDLRQNADGTFPQNPFVPSHTNPLQTVALMSDSEEIWRFLGSAAGTLNLFKDEQSDANLVANLGVDRFQQHNSLLFPPELFFEGDDGLPGTSLAMDGDNLNVNTGLSGSYGFTPSSKAFRSMSTLGLVYETRDLDTVYVTSRNLNAGQSNLDAGSNIDITQVRQKVNDRGGFAQEEVLLLDESLSILGAVLAEQSSLNGDANKLFFYPKAAATYKIPGLEKNFDLLRVRAAYGETGNQPIYGQKFTPLVATDTINGNAGTRNSGVAGDPNIKPERQREIELGVDAVGWDGRAVLELTGYQRTVSDLLLSRTLPPSTGFTAQFFNGGELRNRGVELMVQVEPVKFNKFLWTSRTTFSLNRSKITSLPVPSFQTGGFGTGLGSFRIEEGASATQIVGNDGLLEDGKTCCVVHKLGDTEPTFRMSFVNNFTMGDFGLTSLWDWQQGSDVINLTRYLYDASKNSPDYLSAGMQRQIDIESHAGVYIEDASFLKLREVSVYYELPKSVVSQLGPLSSGTVSLSGRNLVTFTKYSGLDPEVSNFGNQPIARNIDVAPYPPSRSFWLSLSAGF